MGIYIKSMEMPKKCEQCWFFGFDSARVGYCYLLKGELPLPDGVPQDCPLVEVPTPHGRLIDADALLESIKEAKKKQPEISDVYDEDYFAVAEWVSYAPTVIEREKT